MSVNRNAQEGDLWVERNEDISDFYDKNDIYTVTNKERNQYRSFISDLEDWEKATLERAVKEDKNYYVMSFSNVGGLVMPIILELTYTDGKKEMLTLPAEIWRRRRALPQPILMRKSVTERGNRSSLGNPFDVINNHFPRKSCQLSKPLNLKRNWGWNTKITCLTPPLNKKKANI